MEPFNDLYEQLDAMIAALILHKENVKALLLYYHLEPVWSLLRDLYLNPYYMLFVIPLWFVLGRVWPANKSGPHARASVVLDFFYPVLSLPVQVALVVPAAALLRETLETYLPFMSTGLLDDEHIVIQALGAFLIADLMFYVAHVLKHKVPWLWYFHAIHHSQRYVNPLTTHRGHPFEGLINTVIKIVPIAIVGGSYPAWTLFVLVNGMWGYYIHANVRTNLGPLKYIIIAPQHHRLHHTIEPDQIDRNYGERLVLWDWIFGTLYKKFDVYPETGVRGCEEIEEKSTSPVGLVAVWISQFIYPFKRIYFDIRQSVGSLVGAPRT